jgi:hypothetical protein
MFGRYHVTQASRFYEGSAKWLISPDPGSGPVTSSDFGSLSAGVSDTSAGGAPQAATSTGRRIDPYYLYLKLPGETSEHFVVITPFVPVSSNNRETRLVSFLAASSDPGQYGKLSAFTMPQGATVRGPVQVDNDINKTSAISSSVTLLDQRGSSVTQGSLQLIPVGNSLIYVRPYYVQGRGSGSYPQFQFVVVYSQELGAVCAQTVNQGLDLLFSDTTQSTCNISVGNGGTTTPSTTTTTVPGTPTTSSPPTTTLPTSTQALIKLANSTYAEAQAALKAGDFARYATLITQLGDIIAKLDAATR